MYWGTQLLISTDWIIGNNLGQIPWAVLDFFVTEREREGGREGGRAGESLDYFLQSNILSKVIKTLK